MSRDLSSREAKPKSRKEEYAEITKQALHDSALELFVRQGYGKTSIEDIVRKARVTRGAFYYHYKSKEDVFVQVYEGLAVQLVTVIERGLKEIPDPWEKAVAGCRAFLEYCIDPDYCTIRLDDAIGVLGWKRWRKIDSEHTMKIMRDVLQGIKESGELIADNVDLVATMIYAILIEAALTISASREKQKTRDDVLVIIMNLLSGLKKGSRST